VVHAVTLALGEGHGELIAVNAPRCAAVYVRPVSQGYHQLLLSDVEEKMTDLVAISFADMHEADRVLVELNRLQKEYLVDLADAVVVIRQPDGKINLKQSFNVVGAGAASGGLSGAVWGTLVGLLFLNPLAGLAAGAVVGAGAGALSGSLVDYGIDDKFIRSVGETLAPGSSALFILIRKIRPEKVLDELAKYPGGKVLKSSLPPDQERRLEEALSKAAKSENASSV